MINKNVLKSGATTLLAIVGGYVAGKGWVTSDQWAQLSPLLLAIGVGVYKLFDNTDAAVAAKAQMVPGVTVTTDLSATPTVTNAVAKVSSHWFAPIVAGLLILPMLVGCVTAPNGQKTVDPAVLALVQQGAIITCGVAPTASAVANLYTKNADVVTTEKAIAMACAALVPNSVVPVTVAPPITPAATVTPGG